MIETLWIYSRRNDWWTDGVHKITNELVQTYSWNELRDMAYGFDLPHQSLTFFFNYRDLLPPWKPLTPEQVVKILDGKPYEQVRNQDVK